MIWPTDGLRLAMTKIKTRRLRLGITLFVSSLLFVAVAGVLFTVRGVVGSLEDFSKEGLGSRYIISANQANGFGNIVENKDVIARAKEIEKDYLSRRKAEAKKLGLDYDASIEAPAIMQYDGPNGKVEAVVETSYAGKQAIEEFVAAQPRPGEKELRSLAEPYGLTGIYKSSYSTASSGTPTYFRVLGSDGKEEIDSGDGTIKDSSSTSFISGIENFYSGWQSFSEELITPFVLPGQSLAMGDDGAVPILAPYTSLEKILGLPSLPKGSTTKEKLTRLEEIRERAAGFTFQVCYRNGASYDRISTAISQQAELTRNKNNKDYVKPELVYALPAEPCADVRVERDVRTAEAKKIAEKELAFAQAFGQESPFTKIYTFKIVGIVPDSGDFTASTVQQILQSILVSSIGNGWFSSNNVVSKDPVLTKLFTPNPLYGASDQFFVEFATANQARQFSDKQNCNPDFSMIMNAPPSPDGTFPDPYANCAAEGKYFVLYPFGSNSLALEEFKRGFATFFKWFLIVVMAIASLIMMGIVARVIADSRRETAVFRAIGAKRLDIAQIYLTYVAIICVLIGIIATLGGIAIGQWLETRYTADMNIAASIAFNASDTSRQFSFSKLLLPDVLLVWGVIFAVGLIASLLPLASNVRRNPISDMRDER